MLVLVHGNPETAAIWDPLRAESAATTSSPCPRPASAPRPGRFRATSDDYLAWLVDELSALDGPIDLVGHDWGGGHVQRLAATRPDLIRSWVHRHRRLRRPRVRVARHGPGVADARRRRGARRRRWAPAPVADRAAMFVGAGMTEAAAASCAAAFDADMGRCILALYRSAAQPKMTEWGASWRPPSAGPAW